MKKLSLAIVLIACNSLLMAPPKRNRTQRQQQQQLTLASATSSTSSTTADRLPEMLIVADDAQDQQQQSSGAAAASSTSTTSISQSANSVLQQVRPRSKTPPQRQSPPISPNSGALLSHQVFGATAAPTGSRSTSPEKRHSRRNSGAASSALEGPAAIAISALVASSTATGATGTDNEKQRVPFLNIADIHDATSTTSSSGALAAAATGNNPRRTPTPPNAALAQLTTVDKQSHSNSGNNSPRNAASTTVGLTATSHMNLGSTVAPQQEQDLAATFTDSLREQERIRAVQAELQEQQRAQAQQQQQQQRAIQDEMEQRQLAAEKQKQLVQAKHQQELLQAAATAEIEQRRLAIEQQQQGAQANTVFGNNGTRSPLMSAAAASATQQQQPKTKDIVRTNSSDLTPPPLQPANTTSHRRVITGVVVATGLATGAFLAFTETGQRVWQNAKELFATLNPWRSSGSATSAMLPIAAPTTSTNIAAAILPAPSLPTDTNPILTAAVNLIASTATGNNPTSTNNN